MSEKATVVKGARRFSRVAMASGAHVQAHGQGREDSGHVE